MTHEQIECNSARACNMQKHFPRMIIPYLARKTVLRLQKLSTSAATLLISTTLYGSQVYSKTDQI